MPRSVEAPSSGWPATIGLDSTIPPEASATCAKASSASIRREPVSATVGPFARTSWAMSSARESRPASTAERRSLPVLRYTNAPTVRSTAAVPRANTSVTRTLVGSFAHRSIAETVSHPPHGFDRRVTGDERELHPEIADVDVDHVRAALEREVPEVLQERHPRDRLVRTAHEVLQQGELLRGELDRRSAPLHVVERGIEAEIPDLEHRRPLLTPAAEEGADAGVQLLEGERLRQVVVRAHVETAHAIVDGVSRGEHQDGRPRSRLPETPADLEPVGSRSVRVEDHVEHDRVVGVLGRHPERVFAVRRDVHRVALLHEAAPKEAGHLHGVLDDEETHEKLLYLGNRSLRRLHEGNVKTLSMRGGRS